MNDLTFLDEELASDYGASDAILKAVLPGGKVVHISDAVSPYKFLDACPLLYHAFEYNAQSRLQASIDASSETPVIALARYCYTGSYLAAEPGGETIMLLQHAETYKIAEDFDVPELQIMAHGNFSCQIEYSCCLPNPPEDLLDTIRFIYRYFASDEARRKHNLVDTLLNYCVAVYLYHKLGENLDFLTAVHKIAAFRQDLCRTNIARNFEDACAADIIRLPSGPVAESSNALASRQLPNEMLYDLPYDPALPALPSTRACTGEEGEKVTLAYRRGQLCVKTPRQQLPDRSKHCASPAALTAALERYSRSRSRHTPAEDAARSSKRVRFDAEFEAEPPLRVDQACSPAAEASYWSSAFAVPAAASASPSALPCLPPAAAPPSFPPVAAASPSPPPIPASPPPSYAAAVPTPPSLPHRPHLHPDTLILPTDPASPDPANPDPVREDSASEDEGFALIAHPQPGSARDSPMSSPELVGVECEMEIPALSGGGVAREGDGERDVERDGEGSEDGEGGWVEL
ncbi:hypothetical protein C7974DRAFT_53721 [Boeremia exigua]|uniref:uncharacterized protein n=1 Tax=Boeremia exigua TaxID=749465 RepID=UPI001E8CA849|nr:uncharacterized protein C7974DRAFT_53721 [Boeremia exigua]KAH6616880.1 hypothetical protein C7974DRAFT_53721 [Boeremia exigua]